MSDPEQPAAPVEGYSKLVVRLACAAALLAGGLLGWWVVALVIVISTFAGGELHPRTFDAQLWNDSDWRSSISTQTHFHSIRQRMVDDLIAHHLHAKMTQDEVLALLGPRDEKPNSSVARAGAWVYLLGAERGVPIDEEWLVIEFDTTERVSSIALHTD